MRIESPRYTERFGSVRINDVQKVLELDSGKRADAPRKEAIAVNKIEDDAIQAVEEKMAVVIPIKDEKLKLFEGVISGIPHDCLIIVVSASRRRGVDRFRMERDTLEQFCHFTQREALIVHQKDPVLAEAVKAAGYDDMLDGKGLVRSGKAEGMVIGILMAKLRGKEYVSFIDSDNYIPGSVWEYVKIYASGITMARSPYAMVRILWHYKPKMTGDIYFRKWGRVSEVTNRNMNALISFKTGFETDIIKTANAGEHCMTMKLAEMLPYATGFAVEPKELMAIFEGFGGILPSADATASKKGVEIFQIETKNPHFHEERGNQHLNNMLLPGQAVIYHSPLADAGIKQFIVKSLIDEHNAIKTDDDIVMPHLIRPPREVDLPKFMAHMSANINQFNILEA